MTKFYTVAERFAAFLVSLTVTLSFSFAWAWPPTYGAEFEVSTPRLGGYDFDTQSPTLSPEKKEQMTLVEHMRERCASSDCKVIEVPGKWDQDYRVEYADGWWFKISYDPACVEITFKPSTLETLQRKKELINDQIFKSSQEIGLTVRTHATSHFNMGIRSAFDDDGLQFLRFYVDYANHPDLALGSLGFDIKNAPPLSVLGADQREALQQVIQDAADGRLTTIAQIAQAIEDRVYTRSYVEAWGGIAHYQAVGLKYVNKTDLTKNDAPLELRAVWIQDSAEKFNLVSQLIEGRIRFLKTLKTKITYSALDQTSFSASELLTRFYIYVEEAGMHYEDFKSLILVPIQQAELGSFLQSNASTDSRLSDLQNYWDLVESSAYVRAKVVEILSDPKSQNNPLAAELTARLRESANREEAETPVAAPAPAKPGFLKTLKMFLTRTKPVAIAEPSSKPIFKTMLETIRQNQIGQTNQGEVKSCNAVFH